MSHIVQLGSFITTSDISLSNILKLNFAFFYLWVTFTHILIDFLSLWIVRIHFQAISVIAACIRIVSNCIAGIWSLQVSCDSTLFFFHFFYFLFKFFFGFCFIFLKAHILNLHYILVSLFYYCFLKIWR